MNHWYATFVPATWQDRNQGVAYSVRPYCKTYWYVKNGQGQDLGSFYIPASHLRLNLDPYAPKRPVPVQARALEWTGTPFPRRKACEWFCHRRWQRLSLSTILEGLHIYSQLSLNLESTLSQTTHIWRLLLHLHN